MDQFTAGAEELHPHPGFRETILCAQQTEQLLALIGYVLSELPSRVGEPRVENRVGTSVDDHSQGEPACHDGRDQKLGGPGKGK
jgi:hypothetical protein